MRIFDMSLNEQALCDMYHSTNMMETRDKICKGLLCGIQVLDYCAAADPKCFDSNRLI